MLNPLHRLFNQGVVGVSISHSDAVHLIMEAVVPKVSTRLNANLALHFQLCSTL